MKRWIALLALAVLSPAQAEDALHKIFDCMHANLPAALRVQQIELEATDRGGGSRVLSGRLYAMRQPASASPGELRAMLRIDAPDYLAGAAYLVREAGDARGDDEMYVYLPSVKRVRRVVGDAGYDSLLGTNFSYVEFKQMQGAFGDAVPQLEPPAQIEGRPVDVISLRPQTGHGARYSSLRTWVDQKTCVILKAEFYEGEGVAKRLEVPVSGLQQSGEAWYPRRIEMHDLRDGTRTVLRVLKESGRGGAPAAYFDPRTFYAGGSQAVPR